MSVLREEPTEEETEKWGGYSMKSYQDATEIKTPKYQASVISGSQAPLSI